MVCSGNSALERLGAIFLNAFDMATFTTFLPHLASTMEYYLSRTTLDGYIQEGDRLRLRQQMLAECDIES
jgi:hypothetical protein